ncbi:MAG: hypothetical protein O2955_17025, partial [Planctomycetota bacterium]|nr:hypothetical protein [Planctomycetota bacterium]
MIRRIATLLCSLFLITVGAISPANAAEWSNDFESSDTTWTVIHSGTRSRSLAHQRVADFAHSGQGSESFQFQVNSESTIIRLEHALPDAAVIDELTTSVWVNSTRNGAVMKIRVVFPHQINPKTSKPAFVFIQGSRYESEGRWQKLECRAEEKKIHDQIVLMRSQFPVKDLRDAYVDKMIIEIPMESGTANFAIDDASFGPIVSPRVVAPAFVSDDSASSTKKRVKLRLGHLQVDGRPFFPIMTPYHGEAPRDLHDLGVNVVWIPDYQDNDLIDQLRDFDLWSTAVPPQSKSAEGHGLDAQFASLVPFSRKTEAIAFWMLGSKITPDMHKNILTWAEQVRTADRKFDRPLMGDVQGSERVSSRNISLLGTSRPVIQTTFPLRDYRDWLKESRNLAIPGSFVWTWIPTEPYPALASLRNPARQQPLYHEPEQLRLQLFAALAAGCQGIGYWSTTPLNDDDPLAVERRLAISQLNDELQLLGPILATANLKEQIPFSINGEPPPQFANVKVLSLQGRKEYDPNAPVGLTQPRQTDRRQTSSMKQRTSRTPDDMVFEAAFFRSPYGGLILPICYQEHAQFVPGAMTVRDVRILVSDVEDTASAYEITPTRIRYVPKDRVAGGVELKLSTLDMTTAILLTSDQKIKKAFQSRIRDLNSQYAQTTVELARAKFKRTAAIDSQLTSLGAALPDAFIQLSQVGNLLRDADQALERQEFSSACDKAPRAMHYLRTLQRAYWE